MKGKLLMFVLGLVVGVAAAIAVPRFVGPLLPAGLMGDSQAVDGTVVKRQRDEDRLLLTINTAQGAALATFTKQVAEIDLLVEEGDSVTLALSGYEPFVDNPPIRAVRKAETPAAGPAPAVEPPAPPAGELPGDGPAAAEPAGDTPAAELEEWPGDGEGGDG